MLGIYTVLPPSPFVCQVDPAVVFKGGDSLVDEHVCLQASQSAVRADHALVVVDVTSTVYYAILCYAMLCYAMLCYTMLCYTMTSLHFPQNG